MWKALGRRVKGKGQRGGVCLWCPYSGSPRLHSRPVFLHHLCPCSCLCCPRNVEEGVIEESLGMNRGKREGRISEPLWNNIHYKNKHRPHQARPRVLIGLGTWAMNFQGDTAMSKWKYHTQLQGDMSQQRRKPHTIVPSANRFLVCVRKS